MRRTRKSMKGGESAGRVREWCKGLKDADRAAGGIDEAFCPRERRRQETTLEARVSNRTKAPLSFAESVLSWECETGAESPDENPMLRQTKKTTKKTEKTTKPPFKSSPPPTY
jgi:hypothetical protein